jgi:hypothetical protein
MLARVLSAAVNGIEAFPVEVEVNSGWGDTTVVIVGLPGAAVKESRDRVSTALTNSVFNFPMGRTTINLAPTDLRKEGQKAFTLREWPRRRIFMPCCRMNDPVQNKWKSFAPCQARNDCGQPSVFTGRRAK